MMQQPLLQHVASLVRARRLGLFRMLGPEVVLERDWCVVTVFGMTISVVE